MPYKKYLVLLNFTGDKHQKFSSKEKVPLTGGLILLISFFFIFFYYDFILSIYISLIFFLGLFSDLKLISSPKLRFLFQVLLLLSFVYFLQLEITNTRIIILDNMMKNDLFAYLFVVFCTLILINGTNFIDGLNTNVLGYFIILSFCIFQKEFYVLLDINKLQWMNWMYCLFVLFVFNFFNQLFIGDNGAYLIGLLYSFFLIKFHYVNPLISPFYIVLLIWYPCFEILFSVIRKIKFNKSPFKPDNKHLHQMIFYIIKKNFKLKLVISNTLSANLINIYNIIIIFFASLNIYNSQYQILFLILNLIVYVFMYMRIINIPYKV